MTPLNPSLLEVPLLPKLMPDGPTTQVVVKKLGHGYDWDSDYMEGEEYLPNAIDIPEFQDQHNDGLVKLITLREITMLRFMNAVTDKPGWAKKVFNEEIVQRWRREAVTLDPEEPLKSQMTEAMFKYSLDELRYRAASHEMMPGGAVYVFPADVYKSDTAVSAETKATLQQAVHLLEDVPERLKDWHPDSEDKVLDLVHPSLFPLVYGTSKILPLGARATTLEDCIERCGEGDIIQVPGGETPNCASDRFQWLPCEVDISGDRPKILTYINNLHPQRHSELYAVIEDVIAAAIPLWTLTLIPLQEDMLSNMPRRIQYDACTFDPDPANETKAPEQEDGEDDHTYYERYDAWVVWWKATRRLKLPEPPSEFEPLEHLDHESQSFMSEQTITEKDRLQIIVKLANIQLTPEKPRYGGGSWHVEGMKNEAICASAIYYYSCENITPSNLAFRQQSKIPSWDEISYEQGHREWLPQVFGIQDNGSTVQDLGTVDTWEGRLITFPNILQHEVKPFMLDDPTKPGHRKILALFLVDPNINIISTADVPPQRLDWWAEKVMEDSSDSFLGRLPAELKSKICSEIRDFPISMERAKEYREELMEERMNFELENEDHFESVFISLCEH